MEQASQTVHSVSAEPPMFAYITLHRLTAHSISDLEQWFDRNMVD
jgi:hypothetical protein